MAKTKSQFVCQECGDVEPRWMGKCPACDGWNTFVEEAPRTEVKAPVVRLRGRDAGVGMGGGGEVPAGFGGSVRRSPLGDVRPVRLGEVEVAEKHRLVTGLAEFDRVMGGGIMDGSLTLIAGDPGIGKSTLVTELPKHLPGHVVLYVTGEESTQQVKLRAQRLGVTTDDLYLLAETNVEAVVAAAQDVRPDLLVVDSIQTLYRPDLTSAPGSVAQVRESAAVLLELSKSQPLSTLLIGHVTKSGSIAGPRVLEHMVDTVLHFEGDRHHAYRVLRSIKNRFGSAHEIGVFEMREDGLKEVGNPSALFLQERQFGASGSVVVCAMEGTRPMLVEVQALASAASYGTPQRTANGFDQRRLQMLLAVLEKRVGVRVSQQDIFLNIAGGMRLEEPAVDLAVAVAIASSARDVPADSGTAVFGEIGLGGEIRAVPRVDARLSEIKQLGFERVMMPKANMKGIRPPGGLELVPVSRLGEALDLVL